MNQSFIRGEQYKDPLPLEEYLPVYHSGIIGSWLDRISPPSKIVLFPFAGSPQAIIDAARSGYQALVPVHNPITRFLLHRLCQPIPEESFNAALVRLASSYKGKERLKPFILSLYETDCPACGARISARSFTWSRISKEPIQKACLCPNCSEYSESTPTQEDLDKALSYQENSPTHARALTRVAAPDDPIRLQVENALRAYPPRSLYAIFTILNKLTGFDLVEDERVVLETLLLHAFYRCSSPNSSPEDETYLEENVWSVLEETPGTWSSVEKSIPVTTWPELPPDSKCIIIYPGRVRDLLPQLSKTRIGAVWMTFPKPNLSFWALNTLWTGWLWGQEAASPLHNILSLKDYSWTWLTKAVESTLSELWEVMPEGTDFFGLLPEVEIDSLISSITAAASAGFNMESLCLDPDLLQGQTSWKAKEPVERDSRSDKIKETIRSAGLKLLNDSGEPKNTTLIYSAGMAGLSSNNLLPQYSEGSLADEYNQLKQDFENNIAYRQGYLHYPKSDTWWHQELDLDPNPDSDQVEQSLVGYLAKKNSLIPENEIYTHLYQAFPGLRTPRSGLINACLHSYAEPTNNRSRGWKLKANDQPNRRRQDIKEIEKILRRLGNQLGFKIKNEAAVGNIIHLTWNTEKSIEYSFYISASGILNRIITQAAHSPIKSRIIMPGSRAELVYYKIKYNPPLASELEAGWELIKYRHIRRLAEEGGLTRENLQDRLILDPFTSDSLQLQLI